MAGRRITTGWHRGRQLVGDWFASARRVVVVRDPGAMWQLRVVELERRGERGHLVAVARARPALPQQADLVTRELREPSLFFLEAIYHLARRDDALFVVARR